MRKYMYLFICMATCLFLLTGCKANGNSISAANAENAIIENPSSQSADTTDLKPTAYEIINNFDGVTMTVKKGTSSANNLTVLLDNNSGSQCTYGEYFELEKKINEVWYQVPVTIEGKYGFNSIGYGLSSGDHKELEVDWNWLYGSLDAGEYRIVKDILDFRGTGDYDTYVLATEFVVYD